MLQLSQCDSICRDCVKQYVTKHRLRKGAKFDIPCNGIPKDYLPDSIRTSLESPDLALATLDPVTWARINLDWHCLDPDGAVWKRKTEDGTIGELPRYDAAKASLGKSPYNRPYQSRAMRCSSKQKVLRWGRQLGKTSAICVKILYDSFTHANFTTLVVTPYQSQIDLIFKELMTLLKGSPGLTNSIVRCVKAPNYSLELNNGSHVVAFTAGTKSNAEAGAARGTHAQSLILDEADRLSAGDIDSALAVITNFPEATVWMSSTPTGKRERFYKCAHSKLYKEFHYSAKMNPVYSEALERLFRDTYTEAGYIHEVEADWGEQEEGVFQNRYIDLAQDNYTYGTMGPRPTWLYSIGVDWNDTKIGTTLLVTGYNPGDKVFRVVDKRIISRLGWTQLAACEAVIELNRFWNPIAIYVDRGYGHAQVEILQKYGADAIVDPQRGPTSQDARLATLVKSYDFGSTVEVNDLFTKEPVKKPAKAFLIESLVRRFETRSIKYPMDDEKLSAALRGYIIKRLSQSGTPIYEAQDATVGDHLVDALALSIIGFVLEKTEFGQLTFDSHITFSGQFGEKTIYKPQEPISKKTETKLSLKPTERVVPKGHGIPGAHLAEDVKPKLWSWPGFLKDMPPPTRKKSSSRPSRPQRQKF